MRTQGAWLLLGPLNHEQWEEFFSSLLPPAASRRPAEPAPIKSLAQGRVRDPLPKSYFKNPNHMPRQWPPESVFETSSNPIFAGSRRQKAGESNR